MFLVQEQLFLYRLKKEKKSNHLNPLSSNAEEGTGENYRFQLRAFLWRPSKPRVQVTLPGGGDPAP